MKMKLSNFQNFPLKTLFFISILAALVFTGCGKMKQDFQRGLEKGRRESGKIDEPAPSATPITLTAEDLKNEQHVDLDTLEWKYQPGDDVNWAKPEFDDSGWEAIMPRDLTSFLPPKSGWNGIGWFRLPVKIDETLAGQPLSLAVNQPGASDIYVDGKLAQSYGKVAANKTEEKTYNPDFVPTAITFAQAGEHLVAVRYSNADAVNRPLEPLIFQLRLSSLNPTINSLVSDTALKNGIQGGIFGICLALGLLHLLLYVLYPQQIGNLFYSLFLFAEAGSVVFAEIFLSHAGIGAVFTKIFVGTFAGGIHYLSFTAYLYTVLEKQIPRYLRIMALLWTVAVLLIFISYLATNAIVVFSTFTIGILIFVFLMIWHIAVISIIIIRAVARKVDNSWILGLVGFSFIVSAVISTVLVSLFGERSIYLAVGEFSCLTLLIVANAVFLARQFARTSKNLEQQLVKEVDYEKEKARLAVVEAENTRRAEELEEARQLQISMLPTKLPQLPNLEIAAYMKPATEVGGDYYDFHTGADGTLTVAVGDATGHGLKAGSVVTATKSLFNAFADEKNIPQIFTQTSGALKKMNLRGLFMAMAMLKIKDGAMTLCVAGMPSVLIYRAASSTVEEISLRAMPLGSVAKFEYQQREISLAAGDVVVLMSDGFPEMFNSADEMLGFGKAAEVLPDIAHNSPQEIINRLIEIGETWAGARPADDDVTFVVLKAI